jgi:nicotinamidase-related amidase
MESPGIGIGWVVDAQNDFMRPGGRLYVRDLFHEGDPGAVLIVPALVRSVEWMRRHCRLVVFTGDWHGPEDPEIDPTHPDPARGTYPPHCMGRSMDPEERKGAAIISEVAPERPVVIAADAPPAHALPALREAVASARSLILHKTRFDVFLGNTAAEALLDALDCELGGQMEFFVVGVARDVCVTQAVDGLQARGRRVTAIRDAIWGLGLEPEGETLARWSARGRVLRLADLPC